MEKKTGKQDCVEIYTYIIFSQNSWNSPLKYQRHHLAEYLANQRQTRRVIFVSRISVKGVWELIKTGAGRFLSQRFWLSPFFQSNKSPRAKPKKVTTLSARLYPYQLPFLNKVLFFPLLLRRINQAIPRNNQNLIIICYQPIPDLIRLKAHLLPQMFIYVTVHDFNEINGVHNKVPEVEKRLLRSADHAVTDSSPLASKLLGDPTANLLAPACPSSVVKASKINEPQRKDTIRTFVYFGTIAPYLCFPTIKTLRNSGFEVTFLGALNGVSSKFITENLGSGLLPPQDFETASDYLRRYDATILPYIVNCRNANIIPAKIYECLALGIPTFVPKMKWNECSLLRESLYIYESTNSLCRLVAEFDPEKFQKKRRIGLDIAEQNSWNKRFSDLFDRTLLTDAQN